MLLSSLMLLAKDFPILAKCLLNFCTISEGSFKQVFTINYLLLYCWALSLFTIILLGAVELDLEGNNVRKISHVF